MKKIISITIISLIFLSAFAQKPNKGQRRENLLAAKIAFITREISLTPGEAQDFWPLYNEYSDRKDNLSIEKKRSSKKMVISGNTLTSDEKEQIADKVIDIKLQEAIMAKEYHEKFKKVIPIDKILKLYQAEATFKMHLLKKVKENQR